MTCFISKASYLSPKVTAFTPTPASFPVDTLLMSCHKESERRKFTASSSFYNPPFTSLKFTDALLSLHCCVHVLCNYFICATNVKSVFKVDIKDLMFARLWELLFCSCCLLKTWTCSSEVNWCFDHSAQQETTMMQTFSRLQRGWGKLQISWSIMLWLRRHRTWPGNCQKPPYM